MCAATGFYSYAYNYKNMVSSGFNIEYSSLVLKIHINYFGTLLQLRYAFKHLLNLAELSLLSFITLQSRYSIFCCKIFIFCSNDLYGVLSTQDIYFFNFLINYTNYDMHTIVCIVTN